MRPDEETPMEVRVAHRLLNMTGNTEHARDCRIGADALFRLDEQREMTAAAEAARDRAFAEVALLRQPDRLAETAHQMAIRSPLLSPDDALRLLTNAAGFLSRIADLEATVERVRSHSRAVRMIVELAEQDTARDETGGEG